MLLIIANVLIYQSVQANRHQENTLTSVQKNIRKQSLLCYFFSLFLKIQHTGICADPSNRGDGEADVVLISRGCCTLIPSFFTGHDWKSRVRWVPPLSAWSSRCPRQRISITWELVSKANSQGPPQSFLIRNSRDGARQSLPEHTLQGILTLAQVWESPTYM